MPYVALGNWTDQGPGTSAAPCSEATAFVGWSSRPVAGSGVGLDHEIRLHHRGGGAPDDETAATLVLQVAAARVACAPRSCRASTPTR